MRSSEAPAGAVPILGNILNRSIGSDWQGQTACIDDTLAPVLRNCQPSDPSASSLLTALGLWVSHICQHQLPWPRKLSEAQARALGLELLEEAMQARGLGNWRAAILIMEPDVLSGWEQVATLVLQTSITRWQQTASAGIVAALIDPLDIDLQESLAVLCITSLPPEVQRQLGRFSPARWSANLEGLLGLYVQYVR